MSSSGARAAERRFRSEVATTTETTRRAIGWSQAELGRRAALSQATISLIERASDGPSLTAIGATLDTLGVKLEARLVAPFIDRQRAREPVHARCEGYVERRLSALGWRVALETEIRTGDSRGWIDVVAFEPRTASLLVCEVKTELHVLGEIQRTLAWYERGAWGAARAFGWRPRTVTGLLLVLASAAVEDRLAADRALIEQVFTVRGTALRHWIEAPGEVRAAGRGLALIDPLRRGATWLLASAIDGSRARMPYLDYADAARRLTAPRRRGLGPIAPINKPASRMRHE